MTRRIRTIAVVSWLGGAASVLPFTTEWFGLSVRASNLLLLAAVVSAFGLSLAIGRWESLQGVVIRLAGPPERPARTLALVAALAACGLTAMLGASAVAGSLG